MDAEGKVQAARVEMTNLNLFSTQTGDRNEQQNPACKILSFSRAVGVGVGRTARLCSGRDAIADFQVSLNQRVY